MISDQVGKRSSTQAAFQLLKDSANPDLGHLRIAAFWLVVAALLEALGPWFAKQLIDKILVPKLGDVAYVGLILVMVLVTGVLAGWVRFIQLQRLAGLAMRSVLRLRQRVYAHVIRLPMKFFDSAITGQLVSRVTNDTEAVKALYVQVLFVIMEAAITISGIFAVMFWINARLALVACLLIPAVACIVWAYQRASGPAVARSRELRSTINAQMAEGVNGMSVLQASNATEIFAQRFSQTNEAHYQSRQREVRANAWLLRPMVDACKVLLLLAVIIASGWNQDNVIEIGVLYAFISYVERVGQPLIEITVQFSQIQQSVVAASRVQSLLEETEDAHAQGAVAAGQLAPLSMQGEVTFKNLNFAYLPDRPVLKSVDWVVPAGAYVGIVGHTGSGKSTLLSLLLRFYSAAPGQLLIDGRDIAIWPEAVYRQLIGLVPQEPFLLASSALENIDMGRGIPEAELIAAAKAAYAHEFIEQLSHGYQTALGEGGARLSVGQKQLIAIARALAGKPRVLLLDEATSHIDSESEIVVQKALQHIRGQMTVISVAHRLSTVRDADQILVLDHGRVAERGTHNQLLTIDGGIYRRLFELQSLEQEVRDD